MKKVLIAALLVQLGSITAMEFGDGEWDVARARRAEGQYSVLKICNGIIDKLKKNEPVREAQFKYLLGAISNAARMPNHPLKSEFAALNQEFERIQMENVEREMRKEKEQRDAAALKNGAKNQDQKTDGKKKQERKSFFSAPTAIVGTFIAVAGMIVLGLYLRNAGKLQVKKPIATK